MPQTSIRRVKADGVDIFYREAGSPHAPVILLLHGFPPLLFVSRIDSPFGGSLSGHCAGFPGVALRHCPQERNYTYTFEAITQTMLAFTDALGLTQNSPYVFDYGAPVGFRMAVACSERITAIVSQNVDFYFEGLGPSFLPIQRYWSHPSLANRDALRGVFTPDAIQKQYTGSLQKTDNRAR